MYNNDPGQRAGHAALIKLLQTKRRGFAALRDVAKCMGQHDVEAIFAEYDSLYKKKKCVAIVEM